MQRKLTLSLIIVTLIVAIFSISVKITEDKNNKRLVQEYTYSIKEVRNINTTIAPPTAKAIDYHNKRVNLWILNLVMSLLIPVVFLISGLSTFTRDYCLSKSKNLFIVIFLYFIIYSTITTLINLPLDYYSSFTLKHDFGLSNQSFNKWLIDNLKSFIIYTLVGACFVSIPYLLIKKFPNYWWFNLGFLLIPVIAFVTFISPMYIDPIFNKYEKIQNTKLESKIYEELDKASIKNCNVYQVNKSVDTKEMNAYMTGVLNTKRIVLWDTTIKNLTERETLGVLAHEMGHYLMGHVWKSIVLGGIVSIFIFYLVDKSSMWVIKNSSGALGFTKLYDIASLPLLILMLNIFMFMAQPAINTYTRYTETEADRFELELTKDNESSASSMIKLHETSLVLPSPGIIYKLWNYDHPTFEERVKFANSYKPWEQGKPLKYSKYIK
ncbi:M48 family metallopeptidase [Clostridium sp. P21]|uniref:M48 family metallopeptidase n=1 Tax=Clostridium muellerianum TaxID=2716538 RepID=A0A7Y0EF99_9CLOT|nr:M48 family metallopeptidase [Clostridium muellerianum]NMM62338.1 M48 family metallopeptidase [Clostridium muellerianum]